MSINEMGVKVSTNDKQTLSLYIHIPFCNSKCNYCSFVSSVAPDSVKTAYMSTLSHEIKMQAKVYAPIYSVSSIYIGGGTPSCLDNFCIKDLLSCIYKNFAVKNTAEITIEINPNSITSEKIREYILSGVNRFSIGLQSLSSKVLSDMGRTHTFEDFKNTLNMIYDQGIKNVNADIIIGYPKQTLASVKETLNYLIKMKIPHISAYMLQVEKNTKLQALVDSGSVGLPKESTVIKMYNYVYNTLKTYGYERYEISNFAKPSYKSYHNQIYWQRKDYLGLGLAAHSYVDGIRFSNTENLKEYINSIENKQKVPVSLYKKLTEEEKKEEMIMLSLRTSNGLDINEYKKEFNENLLAKKKDIIKKLITNKYLTLTKDNKLKCTEKGFLVINQIILELIV